MIRLLNLFFCKFPFSANIFSVLVRKIWAITIFIKNLFPAKGKSNVDSATFQVTNICNAACIFCAYPIAKMKKGTMPFEIFKKSLIKITNRNNLSRVDLTPTVGDPLIDLNLFEKIKFAKSLGLEVVTTTNAILLAQNCQKILDSGLDGLFLSIPSFEEEDYSFVYGVNSCSKVKNGIEKLLGLDLGKLKVHIRFRNFKKPSEIIKSEFFQRVVKPKLGKNVTFNFTANFDNWGGTIKYLPKGMVMKPNLSSFKTPCTGLSNITVLFDGKVRSCGCRFIETDNDDLVIGHIDEEMEVIENRAEKIIKDFSHGNRPETCKNCSFYNPNSLLKF